MLQAAQQQEEAVRIAVDERHAGECAPPHAPDAAEQDAGERLAPRFTVPLPVPGAEEPPQRLWDRTWFRVTVSVTGTLLFARVFGVPFPDEATAGFLATIGAVGVGYRTFRRFDASRPAQFAIAAVAAGAATVAAFVVFFVLVLFVWMIFWLETTPM